MMKNALINYTVPALIAGFALVLVPRLDDMSMITSGSVYASYGLLALSLALIWGFAGILSFGQTSFFGIGGYAYAIAAINLDNTIGAAVIAIVVAAIFAGLLGYFMFWGRIGDVYLGVITLTVSLILYRFFNQTAGEEWKIGEAQLGGFNGMPGTPILTLPGAMEPIGPEGIYLICIATLLACYLLCRLILATRFGQVAVAIRENETRAELLGYDVRAYRLGIFTLGGAMAGAAGVLFANCVFVSPNMFSLFSSGQLLIWVIVGGLGTLGGPILGCMLVLMMSTALGTVNQGGSMNWLDPSLVLGVVLTLFVLIVPKGLLPLAELGWQRLCSVLPRRSAQREGLGDTTSGVAP